jgi:hypothetical protein
MRLLIENNDYRYQMTANGSVVVSKARGGSWLASYTIYINHDGYITCSCQGFKYHNRQCKHVEAVAEFLEKSDQDLLQMHKDSWVEKISLYRESEALLHQGYWLILRRESNFDAKYIKAGRWMEGMKQFLPLHPAIEKFEEQILDEMQLQKDLIHEEVEKLRV